jgi:asparagine synthase (glutamine-hydrolysing)
VFFGALAAVLPGTKNPKGVLWQLKRFSQTAGFSPEMRNALWSSHFDASLKSSLYTDAFAARTREIDSLGIIIDRYRQAPADTVVDRMLYADVTLYLADTLLPKVDRASMAHALEARSPFLDHEFMEFAARIPADRKVRLGTTKWILKQACRGMLPDDIVHRKKMGFEVPLARWFRKELKDMVSDLLLGKRSLERGYFRREAVQRMLDEHLSGAGNWQHHLYDLLMFELWHQAYIDTAPEGPRKP